MSFTLDTKLQNELRQEFLTPVNGECTRLDMVENLIPDHIRDPEEDARITALLAAKGKKDIFSMKTPYEHVTDEMLHCLHKTLQRAKTLIEGGTTSQTTLEPLLEKNLSKGRDILLKMAAVHAKLVATFSENAQESHASKITHTMYEHQKSRPLESLGEQRLEQEIDVHMHAVQYQLAQSELANINTCMATIDVLDKLQAAVKAHHKQNGHKTAEPGGKPL